FDVLADIFSRTIDDDHGTVVEISDTLPIFLAFFQDVNVHLFTWQYYRFDGIRELINIEHRHPLQLSHFVQIEIVREDFCPQLFAQSDKLRIDIANLREILLEDFYFDIHTALDTLQNIEAATA